MTDAENAREMELSELDEDLRKRFEKFDVGSFPFGRPTQIQTNRLLRSLILELKQ